MALLSDVLMTGSMVKDLSDDSVPDEFPKPVTRSASDAMFEFISIEDPALNEEMTVSGVVPSLRARQSDNFRDHGEGETVRSIPFPVLLSRL